MFVGQEPYADTFFRIRQLRHQYGRFVVDARHQQLVDAVVINIHHLKLVAGELHRVGTFRSYAA